MLASHAKEICLSLYPVEYRARARISFFPNLPVELSLMIHSYRRTSDLCLPLSEMRLILGYGQSMSKDKALDLAFALSDTPWLLLPRVFRLLTPILPVMDKQIALAILSRAPMLICLLRHPWIADHEAGALVVRSKGLCLAFLDPVLQADRDMVTMAYKQNYGSLQYANPSLLQDRIFVHSLLQHDGRGLRFMSLDFRRDKELCMVACHQDWRAYYHVDDILKEDRDICDIVSIYENVLRA